MLKHSVVFQVFAIVVLMTSLLISLSARNLPTKQSSPLLFPSISFCSSMLIASYSVSVRDSCFHFSFNQSISLNPRGLENPTHLCTQVQNAKKIHLSFFSERKRKGERILKILNTNYGPDNLWPNLRLYSCCLLQLFFVHCYIKFWMGNIWITYSYK